MHAYRRLHYIVVSVVAAGIFWAVQNTNLIASLPVINDTAWLSSAARATIPIVALFLIQQTDIISRMVLEKIPFVSRGLRKLLSGNDFIEGDWPLVVVDGKTGAPLYYGFLSIEFRAGQLYVHGDDWALDGQLMHSFQSMQAQYSAGRLQYWYEQGADLNCPDMRGYTEIYFFPRTGPRTHQAGEFLDKQHRNVRFYAIRHNYRFMERRLSSLKDKLAAAEQCWTEVQARTPNLLRLQISQDWE